MSGVVITIKPGNHIWSVKLVHTTHGSELQERKGKYEIQRTVGFEEISQNHFSSFYFCLVNTTGFNRGVMT